jgi:hypothetical protein
MSYFEHFESELAAVGIRGRLRKRILAETHAHLADGDEAAFGDPRALAVRFADELGTQRAQLAARGGFATLALTGLVYAGLVALVPDAGGWMDIASGRNAPLGVTAAIGVIVLPQVAFAAGVAALLRALRLRHAVAVPAAEAGVLLRRTTVALVAGLGAIGALALVAAEFGSSLAGWWTAAAFAGAAATGVLLVVAGSTCLRAARLRPQGPGPAGGLELDLGVAVSPWLFALVVAAGTGAAVTVANGPLQGVGESAATLVGYAALGRYLALR